MIDASYIELNTTFRVSPIFPQPGMLSCSPITPADSRNAVDSGPRLDFLASIFPLTGMLCGTMMQISSFAKPP